jgi:hypothetical protein
MDDVSAQMIVEVILRSEGHQNAQIVSKLVAVMSVKSRQELLVKLFDVFPNAATRDGILKLVRAGSSPVYQGSKVQQFKGLTTFIWKV